MDAIPRVIGFFSASKLVPQSHSKLEYACGFTADMALPSPLPDTFDVAPFHRRHRPASAADFTSKALRRA